MRNIGLLMRKDFISAFTSIQYVWLYLIMWFFLIALIPTMSSLMYVVMIFVLVINLFTAEENDLVCNVTGILPIRRGQPVLARYLYTYSLLLCQSAVAILTSLLADYLNRRETQWLPPLLLAIASSLVLISINFPLIYAYGVAKMRIITTILYLLMVVASSAMGSAVNEVLPGGAALLPSAVTLVVAFLLSLVSLGISHRIKTK